MDLPNPVKWLRTSGNFIVALGVQVTVPELISASYIISLSFQLNERKATISFLWKLVADCSFD